jgi:Flp pilus assembly protein TadD
MCRNWALAATAVALCLTPGLGLAKSKGEDKAKNKPDPATASAEPARRAKATADQRAMAERTAPLTRAAFWAREADIDANDVEAGVNLSRALRALGSYDDAFAAIQKQLMAQPNSREALLELARIHVARGKGFYAIEPARRAQAMAPRDWNAPTLLAVAYEQAQRDDEARAAHEQARALAPDNPAVLSNYAIFLASHGESARAEALLREASARPGSTIQVRQNLALIVGLQGRLAEAEKIARQDLPPEMVAANLAYLRAANGVDVAPPSTRSWDGLRAAP